MPPWYVVGKKRAKYIHTYIHHLAQQLALCRYSRQEYYTCLFFFGVGFLNLKIIEKEDLHQGVEQFSPRKMN